MSQTPSNHSVGQNSASLASVSNVLYDLNHSSIMKVVHVRLALQDSQSKQAYIAPHCLIDCDAQIGSPAWFKFYCAQFKLEPVTSPDYQSIGGQTIKQQCNNALRDLAEAGAIWRYGLDGITNVHHARLDHELTVLADMGLSAHFLMAWDLVHKAREKGIHACVGYASMNSLVAYVLGMLSLCPIEHGMLFESFAYLPQEERPTVALQCCPDERNALIQQLEDTYGHVAVEPVYHRHNATSCFTDLGPLMGLSEKEVDACRKYFATGKTLKLEEYLEREPEFRALHDRDTRVQRVVTVGKKLEGGLRSISDHPSNLIVSSRPLENIVPLRRVPDCDRPVVGWDRPVIDALGLTRLNLDATGVMSILRRTREHIRATHPPKVIQESVLSSRRTQGLAISDSDVLELAHLPCDDPRVFGFFKTGDLAGVEFGGPIAQNEARETYQAVELNRFESLIAAVALQRYSLRNLLPVYRARRQGHEPIPLVHPVFDRITAPTYGLILYLDQVAQALHELTGQPMKVIFQVLHEVKSSGAMAAETEQLLVTAMTSNSLTPATAMLVVERVREAAINAHGKGRVAWGAVQSYWCAYLKVYFPEQFGQAYFDYQVACNQAIQ
jgi:DNA polymerase III subunit alpha